MARSNRTPLLKRIFQCFRRTVNHKSWSSGSTPITTRVRADPPFTLTPSDLGPDTNSPYAYSTNLTTYNLSIDQKPINTNFGVRYRHRRPRANVNHGKRDPDGKKKGYEVITQIKEELASEAWKGRYAKVTAPPRNSLYLTNSPPSWPIYVDYKNDCSQDSRPTRLGSIEEEMDSEGDEFIDAVEEVQYLRRSYTGLHKPNNSMLIAVTEFLKQKEQHHGINDELDHSTAGDIKLDKEERIGKRVIENVLREQESMIIQRPEPRMIKKSRTALRMSPTLQSPSIRIVVDD